jgi:hypothetical protein
MGVLAFAVFAVLFFTSSNKTVSIIGAVGALASILVCCVVPVYRGIVSEVEFETGGPCSCSACRDMFCACRSSSL